MSNILSEYAVHVGTGTSLGPVEGQWHRDQADWLEKELRNFIYALAAELRLVKTDDPERRAAIDALLNAHPKLIAPSAGTEQ